MGWDATPALRIPLRLRVNTTCVCQLYETPHRPPPPPCPPAAATPTRAGRTWAEMQAHLRQQTPRSRSVSREGTAGGTPGTKVVRLKPLE